MSSAALPFGITVCGIGELAGHCRTGASHVLSVLDPDHPVPEAFGAIGAPRKLGVRLHDVLDDPPGLLLPQPEHVGRVLALGRDLLAEPKATAHLLVHCHAGISRSTACMALILAQALPGQPAAAVLERVHELREKAWPNLRLMEIGDAMLGRRGTLVEATHALHRLQIEHRPHSACGGRRSAARQARSRSARSPPATGGEVAARDSR